MRLYFIPQWETGAPEPHDVVAKTRLVFCQDDPGAGSGEVLSSPYPVDIPDLAVAGLASLESRQALISVINTLLLCPN
ncbi:hypothetical protein [Desulfolithobacter sp.]